MPENPPVVVLVHGAFAESASWNGVLERLHAHSVDVLAVANPLREVAGDARYVRDVIASIDGPVLLVGHSYGGVVVTEAAAENPAVRGLVYVCAFAPDHGESALQLSSQFPGSTLGDAIASYPVSSGGHEFAIRSDRFGQQFAADVSQEVAALMGATQRPVTEAALSAGLPTQAPAWKVIPSWFVFGDQDLNMPVELHRFLAERSGSRGTTEVAGGSHALMVSRPDAVTSTIVAAVQAVSLAGATTP